MAGIAGETRAGEFGGGAAERDDHAGADRGGDMHGTGVIGDEVGTGGEGGGQFTQGGASGQVDDGNRRVPQGRDDSGDGPEISRTANNPSTGSDGGTGDCQHL